MFQMILNIKTGKPVNTVYLHPIKKWNFHPINYRKEG